jgi:hypothetical protein
MKKELILDLFREESSKGSTIGKLHVNGTFFCFTLEDVVRDKKIKSVTAIPSGIYEVIISFSNRFQKQMPLLLNVPGYEGVRIHPGNYSKDSDGCILVGSTRGVEFIGNSKTTYIQLFGIIEKALRSQKVFINVHGGPSKHGANKEVVE